MCPDNIAHLRILRCHLSTCLSYPSYLCKRVHIPCTTCNRAGAEGGREGGRERERERERERVSRETNGGRFAGRYELDLSSTHSMLAPLNVASHPETCGPDKMLAQCSIAVRHPLSVNRSILRLKSVPCATCHSSGNHGQTVVSGSSDNANQVPSDPSYMPRLLQARRRVFCQTWGQAIPPPRSKVRCTSGQNQHTVMMGGERGMLLPLSTLTANSGTEAARLLPIARPRTVMRLLVLSLFNENNCSRLSFGNHKQIETEARSMEQKNMAVGTAHTSHFLKLYWCTCILLPAWRRDAVPARM